MKNAIKAGLAGLFSLFLVTTFAMPGAPVNMNPVSVTVTCPGPNVSITSQSSGSISFAWDAVSGATGYKVWYIRNGSDGSQEFGTGSTTMSFSNLPSGSYDFYFETVCAEGGGYVIIDDIMM